FLETVAGCSALQLLRRYQPGGTQKHSEELRTPAIRPCPTCGQKSPRARAGANRVQRSFLVSQQIVQPATHLLYLRRPVGPRLLSDMFGQGVHLVQECVDLLS